MNTTRIFNSEYFRNRFEEHDAIIKQLIWDRVIPKTSSRKKRDYEDAFVNIRFSDELNMSRSKNIYT